MHGGSRSQECAYDRVPLHDDLMKCRKNRICRMKASSWMRSSVPWMRVRSLAFLLTPMGSNL